ncbi:DUF1294 domain-containing protein [Alishewanella longhuensis]
MARKNGENPVKPLSGKAALGFETDGRAYLYYPLTAEQDYQQPQSRCSVERLFAVRITPRAPAFIVARYLLLSIFTYLSYWFDKRKAQAGRWRTPESTLQFMSLLGGWPGALLAQRYLRHKSQKRSFLWQFWFTVVLNLAALLYLSQKLGF